MIQLKPRSHCTNYLMYPKLMNSYNCFFSFSFLFFNPTCLMNARDSFQVPVVGYWVDKSQEPFKHTFAETLWMRTSSERNPIGNPGGLSSAQYYSENICNISVRMEQVFHTKMSDDSEHKWHLLHPKHPLFYIIYFLNLPKCQREHSIGSKSEKFVMPCLTTILITWCCHDNWIQICLHKSKQKYVKKCRSVR